MNNKKLIRFEWAMKTLLRDKANFDVLEGFLCALLEDDSITILTILESETNAEDENDKFNRVDLLVQDSQNRKIYIEIQNTRETDYLESLLYSTSKIIVEHQDLGQDFKDISKVILISILYFNLGIGDDYIYYGTTDFKGLNTGNQLIVKKRIKIAETLEPKYKFIEKKIFPEYYLITVERYKNIVQKRIDEVKEGSTSKNIDKAKQKLAQINMSDAERKRYEKYLINLAKDKDIVNTAKEEGREEGVKIGIEKGIYETVKNGIIAGLSNEIIKLMTKLNDEQIDIIRKELETNNNV
ncbi:MAG: Rpn family recombination-promoting nuclease/putative transposase [Bacteroidales bacterium]